MVRSLVSDFILLMFMTVRFIRVVGCSSSSFCVVFYGMVMSQLCIPSSVDGYLGCFQCGAPSDQ